MLDRVVFVVPTRIVPGVHADVDLSQLQDAAEAIEKRRSEQPREDTAVTPPLSMSEARQRKSPWRVRRSA